MSNFGSIIEARKRSVVNERAERGVTFIELLVVLGIVSLLSTLLISGYSKMESGFRANTAFSQVESTLHYARNLAIANNCVYHVRFENVNSDLTPISRADTRTGVDHQQTLGIYCFPDMGTALSVTHASNIDVSTGQPIKWNPSNTLTLNSVLHNNYLVERVALPDNTYYGVQYLSPSTASAPYDSVIYFKPDGTQYFTIDGTSQTGLTLFVTDGSQYADDRTLDVTSYTALQDNRRSYFNTRKTNGQQNNQFIGAPNPNNKAPWMKMIQVFNGGMIRVLPAGAQL